MSTATGSRTVSRRVGMALWKDPRLKGSLLSFPSSFWFLVFLLIPLFFIVAYGFATTKDIYVPTFEQTTFDKYLEVLNPGGVAVRLTLQTILFSVGTTVAAAAVSFPIAYLVARRTTDRTRGIFVGLLIIPFWISFVVQLYALLQFVQPDGFIDQAFRAIGLRGFSQWLLGNFGMGTSAIVVVVLVYIWVPYMLLPVFTSILKIDKELYEAAENLGAGPWKTFWNVTFPLSFRGLITGSILVFITALGSFVEPGIFAGKDNVMIGQLIYEDYLAPGRLPLGAAASIFLVAFTVPLLYMYGKYAEGEGHGGAERFMKALDRLGRGITSLGRRVPFRPPKPALPREARIAASSSDAGQHEAAERYRSNGGAPVGDGQGNGDPPAEPASESRATEGRWEGGTSSTNPQALKALDNTRGGVELLLFGSALAWIPSIRPVGWALAILGAGLIALGRSAGGRAHAGNALRWSPVYVLLGVGVPLVQFLAGQVPAYLENPGPLGPLIPAYLALLGAAAGMALAAAPASVLLTYGIQDRFERRLLTLGLYALAGLVAAQAAIPFLALAFQSSPSIVRSLAGPIEWLFLVPSLLFAIPYFRLWTRIARPSLVEQVFDSVAARRGTALLRIFAVLVMLGFYIPLAMIVFFSFNAGTNSIQFAGFSLRWYVPDYSSVAETTRAFFADPEMIEALQNSFIIGIISTALSLVIGTPAALALVRHPLRGKRFLNTMLYTGLVIPSIVLGISISLFIVFLNDYMLGPLLGTNWVHGYESIIVGHTTFSIPIVIVIMVASLKEFDRSLEEAAMDLGADELTTFFRVTLPVLKPALVSAALLAFTFSFDELIVTIFLQGQGVTTLPVQFWSLLGRRVPTPELNAASAIIIAMSVAFVLIANKVQKGGTLFRI